MTARTASAKRPGATPNTWIPMTRRALYVALPDGAALAPVSKPYDICPAGGVS
jgi:hypothetical protein